uniref:Light harvesting protein n=1 Tax=Alexandrium monilatum TaxID=311494 RepID=A0A7S4SR35_9DINO
MSPSVPFLNYPEVLDGWVGGEKGFDPLNVTDALPVYLVREAELKHGRVCMLATVGFAAQQFVTFPGEKPTPDSLQAVYTASPAAWACLLFLAGWIESSSYGGKITMLDMFEEDREPGNLGFGTRFIAGKSAEETKDIRLKELNNGRLAMMAFGGMVHHNLVVKGPLFPLFPEGWVGPQYTWEIDSVMGGLQNQPVPP